VTRLLGIVTHNWPLKLMAVILATLLYAGLVVSQSNFDFDTAVPINTVNQPADAVLLGNLPPVSRIRYVATGDVGPPPTPESFRATVNLAGVNPSAGSTYVPVDVQSVDPRFLVIDYEPRGINIQLDPRVSKQVPVKVKTGPIPADLEVRPPVLTPETVTVSGPASVVQTVVAAQADVLIDPNGLIVDRDIPLIPVDIIGNSRTPVQVEPQSVHVRMEAFHDRREKTLAVHVVTTGTPPTGYAVDQVTIEPATVLVEGEPAALATVSQADTAPVSLTGITGTLDTQMPLALPPGVIAVGSSTVHVRITMRAETGTRVFSAGIVLAGRSATLGYTVAPGAVQAIVAGPLADLSRLDASQFTVAVDVAGLTSGSHELVPTATLQAGLRLLSVDPVTVTIAPGGNPSPALPGG
jgi:YbbR domain-containing protein